MSFFARHGYLCASRPVEVITVTTVTTGLVLCYLGSVIADLIPIPTDGGFTLWPTKIFAWEQEADAPKMALKTLVRCLSLLHTYNQLQLVHRACSKLAAGLTAAFAVMSVSIFGILMRGVLNIEFSEIGDLVLFYLFWVDLGKIGRMVKNGIESGNYFQQSSAMANSFERMGPRVTLESLIQILIISTGLISGLRQLEVLASLGLLAIITNYIIFMTLFPASLSMILEMTRRTPTVSRSSSANVNNKPVTSQRETPFNSVPSSPTPVSRSSHNSGHHNAHSALAGPPNMKFVIATSFFLLQSYGYWNFSVESSAVEFKASSVAQEKMDFVKNQTEEGTNPEDTFGVLSFLFLRVDQAIILALVVVLSIKYILYDSKIENIIPAEDFAEPTKGAPVQKAVFPMVKNDSATTTHSGSEEDEEFVAKENNCVHPRDAGLSNISFTVGESESDSDQENLRKKHIEVESTGVQTAESCVKEMKAEAETRPVRPMDECLRIYNAEEEGARCLTDAEVITLVNAKKIPAYLLEKAVQDEERGVCIRRKLVGRANDAITAAFDDIPYKHYDYSKITGACCENVVGYIPVPVGVVGPLNLDGKKYTVPMATTEGCLVASTNRGCRALASGGIRSRVVGDGMTRGPVVRFPNAMKASDAAIWIQNSDNFHKLKQSFDSSSRFARLDKVTCRPAGRYLFIRFVARTGDAMGMNMISKGTEISLNTLQDHFPDMEILSLSGNICTDKKPAAVNWLEGRGKSVVAEAVVSANVVHNVLKTSTAALVELNIAKNLVGSAIAGSIGGYNAHAANIVAAIYIATGQDTAQCVGSSNCITLMEPWGPDGQDLYITCTMPSMEVGTVGGGTVLPPQSACLKMLGLQGPNLDEAGENAKGLARVICATVLAGELSLMSALAAGHLVRSHLKHNRSSANVDASLRAVATSPAAFASLAPPSSATSASLGKSPAAVRELIPKILTSKYNYDERTNITRSVVINKDCGGDSECDAGSNSSTISSLVTSSTPSSPLKLQSASLNLPVTPKSLDLLSVPTECKQF